MNLLAELVRALEDGGIEPVPAGWQTAREIAEESGKSIARVSEVLRDAVERGLVEVKAFRIRAGNKVYPVPHYRRVPK